MSPRLHEPVSANNDVCGEHGDRWAETKQPVAGSGSALETRLQQCSSGQPTHTDNSVALKSPQGCGGTGVQTPLLRLYLCPLQLSLVTTATQILIFTMHDSLPVLVVPCINLFLVNCCNQLPN